MPKPSSLSITQGGYFQGRLLVRRSSPIAVSSRIHPNVLLIIRLTESALFAAYRRVICSTA